MSEAKVMAGYADRNASLYRRIGLPLGDPAAWIEFADSASLRIVRDLEMDRVRKAAPGEVHCPADHAPEQGLDGDREIATAQALAFCLSQRGVSNVTVDRTFPQVYASEILERGITLRLDHRFGVDDRRCKTEAEIQLLQRAQEKTEAVMRLVCERIAGAEANADGVLSVDGETLTSEGLCSWAAVEFLRRGCSMSHGAIVAGPPESADCHHRGAGPLKTGVPVIVDLFPRDEETRYHGDCTRTVVHGTVSETVQKMHHAVVEAKKASEEVLRAGATGEAVHVAGEKVLQGLGYPISRGVITDEPSIQHGTGHGIGLEVHEPILLDHGGGVLMENEVVTVEPGLYGRSVGGVRVEDMLVTKPDGCVNLNSLPDGLSWL